MKKCLYNNLDNLFTNCENGQELECCSSVKIEEDGSVNFLVVDEEHNGWRVTISMEEV